MSDKILHLSTEEFDHELKSYKGLLVLDFFSEDCPPCAQLAPIYERMAEKFLQVKFVKMMRQEHRPLAERFSVKGSPTVLFFENGQEVGNRLTGYIAKSQMRIALEKLLGIEPEEIKKEVVEADVLVLGGGPAGLTTAIYASRSRLRTIVIEEGIAGGQAATTYHIANYPGTPGTLGGKVLMENMITQAKSFGTEIHDLKEVFSIDLNGKTKEIVTEDTVYHAPVVVIATGAESRRLPAEGEADFRGNGVHYCATCDGAMYQDADNVIVVGGGNSAVEEAVYLTKFAKHVTILHQFDHFQASKTAQEEAAANDKISVIWDSEVRSLLGEKHLTGVKIQNVKTHEESKVEANGVFVYIGMQPRTQLLKDQLKINDWGYIESDSEMRTNIEGVFVAGDVRSKTVRQVATAVGDGAVAAVNAERYLASHK
ncbi:thioredoxin-disulfide reductase [Desulfitobacterium metallireducens]|uniref:Thioredoxin reductase n=1 Tax=Desulfitobacterium metallireducens DSM 15288 TaxID=871968 RepID=W0E6Q2_9FIRM|nr:thioredoxin-disulfide reductase [Desulfitobacterium metallireducens]AHF06575.1 thioredoxin reductase [Desulfitobacterium metallireducens DSM 15288]